MNHMTITIYVTVVGRSTEFPKVWSWSLRRGTVITKVLRLHNRLGRHRASHGERRAGAPRGSLSAIVKSLTLIGSRLVAGAMVNLMVNGHG